MVIKIIIIIQAVMIAWRIRDKRIRTVLCCIEFHNAQPLLLWIGFCLTGSISLCVDSFVFISVYFVFLLTAYVLYM